MHRVLKPDGDLRKQYKAGDVFIEMFGPDALGQFFHLSCLNGTDFTGSMQVLHAHRNSGLSRMVSATGAKALQMDDAEHPLGLMLVHEAL